MVFHPGYPTIWRGVCMDLIEGAPPLELLQPLSARVDRVHLAARDECHVARAIAAQRRVPDRERPSEAEVLRDDGSRPPFRLRRMRAGPETGDQQTPCA